MDTVPVRMTNLFNQLGLDSSPQAIAQFIAKHNLKAGTSIAMARCWNKAQREVLAEMLESDDEWAIMVDELGAAMTRKPTLH